MRRGSDKTQGQIEPLLESLESDARQLRRDLLALEQAIVRMRQDQGPLRENGDLPRSPWYRRLWDWLRLAVPYWRSSLPQWRDKLKRHGYDIGWPLFWLVGSFIVGVGIAVSGSFVADRWFPPPQGTQPPVPRADVARAVAAGVGLLLPVLSTPMWFRPARSLQPILVPVAILLVTVLTGGAAVYVFRSIEGTEADSRYLVAVGAGLVSVLAASVKWAFDSIGAHRQAVQEQNSKMAARVDEMVKRHYSHMLRRAKYARDALYSLSEWNEFPERLPIAVDRSVASQHAAYALAAFLWEERRLYEETGAVFLASRDTEHRVNRLLEIIRVLLELYPEVEDVLVQAVRSLAFVDGADEARDSVVPLTVFVQAASSSQPLRGAVDFLGHRLDHPRIIVAIVHALDEFRWQLLGGMSEIYRHWYLDWQPLDLPQDYLGSERQMQVEWKKIIGKLEELHVQIRQGPTDIAERLEFLINLARGSVRNRDPFAIFAAYEEKLEILIDDIILRFRSRRAELNELMRSILADIGVGEESRYRFSLERIEG